MVGAGNGGSVAGVGAAEAVAPVTADVEEGVDGAAAVAHDQDGVFAHVGGEVVAGIGDLGLVAEEEPAAGENALQFLLVDVGFDEDATADKAAFRVDQSLHFGNHIDLCFFLSIHEWARVFAYFTRHQGRVVDSAIPAGPGEGGRDTLVVNQVAV